MIKKFVLHASKKYTVARACRPGLLPLLILRPCMDPLEEQIRPACEKVSQFQALAAVLGVFLVGTAALKTLSVADAESELVYEVPRWLTITAVQAELAVGLLLLSGLWPSVARQATIALFGMFAIFSLYRAVAGYESCGCLGSVGVNPWWTLTFDAGVLAIVSWGPIGMMATSPEENRRIRSWICVASYGPLATLSLLHLAKSEPAHLDASGALKLTSDSRLVVLEPADWIGKVFPLSGYLSPPVDLSKGRWTILMYHHDCPKCQEVLPRYEVLADANKTHGKSHPVLLLEVPPFGAPFDQAASSAIHARLSDEHEWFVQAPVELRLNNGRVATSSLELPSLVEPRRRPEE